MSRFYDMKDPKTILEFSDLGNVSCLLFCEEGRVSILLDNRICNLGRNALSIIPPFSSLKFIEVSDDVECWIMKMDMQNIADAVLELPIETKMEIRKDSCRYITEVQRERVLSLKRIMEDRLASAGEDGYFMVKNVLNSLKKAFCYEVVQAFVAGTEPEDEAQMDRKMEIFNAFLASAKLNFASRKHVSYYAGEQNLSPAYFSSVIKDVSGRSAKFWIENITFTSAVNYLKNPSYPIRDIAWILKFPDQSSFGKYFKNISGYSPAEYRKKFL